ncbi:hypothetical protein [Sphaerochaeta sp.]|uniref:hypothetical protein n=1 Tax=Sphaerochaeta sp. TaxID=1972642 RepID=UPI00258E1A10|nr:hypothetical protein [Sphaerochaeta sp.]MDD3456845.1 hypothetical protein [Sphaerochaeta sp.]
MRRLLSSTILCFLIFLASCVSAQGEEVVQLSISAEFQDPNAIYGKGMSDSKNKEQDYIIARNRAIEDLVSKLASSIVSSNLVDDAEDDGDVYHIVREQISLSISQGNIEGLQIHPFSYSPTDGYVVYASIPKAAWEEKQEHDILLLETNVSELLHAAENATSYLSEYSMLLNAMHTLSASPYAPIASGTAYGMHSQMENLIERRLLEIPQELTWEFSCPDRLPLSMELAVNLKVSEEGPSPQGKSLVGIPLKFTLYLDESLKTVGTSVLDGSVSQEFLFQVPLTILSTPTFELRIYIDWDALAADVVPPNDLPLFTQSISIGELTFDVQPLDETSRSQALEIGNKIAFSLGATIVTQDMNPNGTLGIGLEYIELPEIENSGLEFVTLNLTVGLVNSTGIVLPLASYAIKGGGLGLDAAKKTAYKKLVDAIRMDSEWNLDLARTLYSGFRR